MSRSQLISEAHDKRIIEALEEENAKLKADLKIADDDVEYYYGCLVKMVGEDEIVSVLFDYDDILEARELEN